MFDRVLILKKAEELLSYTSVVPVAIKIIENVIIPTVGSDWDIKWWREVIKELQTRI